MELTSSSPSLRGPSSSSVLLATWKTRSKIFNKWNTLLANYNEIKSCKQHVSWSYVLGHTDDWYKNTTFCNFWVFLRNCYINSRNTLISKMQSCQLLDWLLLSCYYVAHIFRIVWIIIPACLIKQPNGTLSRMYVRTYISVKWVAVSVHSEAWNECSLDFGMYFLNPWLTRLFGFLWLASYIVTKVLLEQPK